MKDRIGKTAVRYLTGTSDNKDIIELAKNVSSDSEAQSELFGMEMLYTIRDANNYDEKEIMDSFAAFRQKYKRKCIRKRNAIKFSISASALFAVAACFLIFTLSGQKHMDFSVGAGGEVREIRLNDGSKVWLNSSSELRVYTQGRDDALRMRLTGEGYFEVRPRKQEAPFIVETGYFTVKVTGTSFNIRTYEGDRYAEATLASGSINIEDTDGNDILELMPGQKVRYDMEKKTFSVIPCETGDVGCWKSGWLSFSGMTLSGMFEELSRVYDIPIIISDDIDSDILVNTGLIKKVDSVSSILDDLEFVFPFEYSTSAKGILITEKHTNND